MLRLFGVRTNPYTFARRFYTSETLPNRIRCRDVETVRQHYNDVDVNTFREHSFIAEKPLLMTPRSLTQSIVETMPTIGIPAGYKWCYEDASKGLQRVCLSGEYMSKFGDTILPYEITIVQNQPYIRRWIEYYGADPENQELVAILEHLLEASASAGLTSFHRFNAPLSLFLKANRKDHPSIPRLYIAQAQIADLPLELREDLQTPRLVKEAGKGDIYDANIWLGTWKTSTPLHKDPNPNFFVQLAGKKAVRLFEPSAGEAIFKDVQSKLGQNSSSTLRGDEMMVGPEQEALEKAVWSRTSPEVYQVKLNPGDALFIPQGWWHSLRNAKRSLYSTASVNWWFR